MHWVLVGDMVIGLEGHEDHHVAYKEVAVP